MRKGAVGDRMYVSIKGRLGIFISDYYDARVPDLIVGEYKPVGDASLKNLGDRRSATVTAVDPGETILISLDRENFMKIARVSTFL